jgi:Na+/proline symporter
MTARGLILLIGVVLFLISYAFPLSEDLWDYLLVSGAIYTSSAFPVLTAGLYWKRASSTGAVLAMVAGCFAVLGIEAVRLAVFEELLGLPGPALAALTGTRIGLGVVALAWVLMVAGSLLFPDRPKEAAA